MRQQRAEKTIARAAQNTTEQPNRFCSPHCCRQRCAPGQPHACDGVYERVCVWVDVRGCCVGLQRQLGAHRLFVLLCYSLPPAWPVGCVLDVATCSPSNKTQHRQEQIHQEAGYLLFCMCVCVLITMGRYIQICVFMYVYE